MKYLDLSKCRGIDVDFNHQVLAFAADELRKILHEVSGIPLAGREWCFKLVAGNDDRDGFEISYDDNMVLIHGNNPRSVLYGVYALLEDGFGIRYYHNGETTLPPCLVAQFTVPEQKSNAVLSVRGFMLENVANPELSLSLIDYIVKNRGNAVYTHFKDLEQAGMALIEACRKRGIEYTVGGHSCSRFLKDDSGSEQLYQEGGQLCYNNPELIDILCCRIADYLRKYPGIDRLSLWPSDNKNDCGCEECRRTSFNARYVCFMEILQEYLQNAGIKTQVEHIAYNAGLNDEMMARPDIDSPLVDTLFAYWGRDYRYSMDEVVSPCDRQGREDILNWNKYRRGQTGRQFRLLEYYNDFWMLTHFFPYLPAVIGRDAAYFHQQGISGVISLVVPGAQKNGYPWPWVMGVNTRAACGAWWYGELDAGEFADDYIRHYYGGQEAAREIYQFIASVLPELTSFNIPLFRLRFCDMWISDEQEKFNPVPWRPDRPATAGEKQRDIFVMRAAAECAALNARIEYLPPLNDNGLKLLKYLRFLSESLNGLALSVQARNLMYENYE